MAKYCLAIKADKDWVLLPSLLELHEAQDLLFTMSKGNELKFDIYKCESVLKVKEL